MSPNGVDGACQGAATKNVTGVYAIGVEEIVTGNWGTQLQILYQDENSGNRESTCFPWCHGSSEYTDDRRDG